MDPTLARFLERLEVKLDALDGKLDAHREEYLPRVGQLEYRVDQLEKATTERVARRWSTWQLSGVAGVAAMFAGAVDWLKTLIGG